jgi:hypothetical protein
LFRAINAFLNTGKGGTVYLGIVDAGAVKGIRLSQYQVYIVIHVYTRKLNVVSSWNQLLADFSIPKSSPLRQAASTCLMPLYRKTMSWLE